MDPYTDWLGIPTNGCPPNHYELLGLEVFEQDLELISSKGQERFAVVHPYQIGAHRQQAIQLTKEISQALVCLEDPAAKADYDRKLQEAVASQRGAALAVRKPKPGPNRNSATKRDILFLVCTECGALAPVPAQSLRDGSQIGLPCTECGSAIEFEGLPNDAAATPVDIERKPDQPETEPGIEEEFDLDDVEDLIRLEDIEVRGDTADEVIERRRISEEIQTVQAEQASTQALQRLRQRLSPVTAGQTLAPREPGPHDQRLPRHYPRVWAIDVGRYGLKAIRLCFDKHMGSVHAEVCAHFEYPLGATASGPAAKEVVKEALQRLIATHPIDSDHHVAVGIAGNSALVRCLKLPPVSRRQLPKIATFEARQAVPFSLDDVEWEYQLLPGSTEEGGFLLNPEIRIVAAKKERIDLLLQPFSEVGVRIDFVQVLPLAMHNFAAHDLLSHRPRDEDYSPDAPPASLALFSVGLFTSDLVVTDGFRPWMRSIPLGGSHFTKAICKTLKTSDAEAEALKQLLGEDRAPKEVVQAVHPVLRDLAAEIQRSLGYFLSTHDAATIEKILFFGRAVKSSSLTRGLSELLAYPIESPHQIRTLNSVGGVRDVLRRDATSFVACYGLGLQALGLAPLKTNLLPAKRRRANRWARLPQAAWKLPLKMVGAFDRVLGHLVGMENTILRYFVRGIVVVNLLVMLAATPILYPYLIARYQAYRADMQVADRGEPSFQRDGQEAAAEPALDDAPQSTPAQPSSDADTMFEGDESDEDVIETFDDGDDAPDAGANADAGMERPTTADQPMPSDGSETEELEIPAPRPPLEDLLQRKSILVLPRYQPQLISRSQPRAICRLYVDRPNKCNLSIWGIGALWGYEREPDPRFQVVTDDPDGDTRTWTVAVRNPDGTTVLLATFLLRNQSLSFQWDQALGPLAVDSTAAMSSSVLRVEIGDANPLCPLSVPISVPSQPFSLAGTSKFEIPSTLRFPKDLRKLQLILFTYGFPKHKIQPVETTLPGSVSIMCYRDEATWRTQPLLEIAITANLLRTSPPMVQFTYAGYVYPVIVTSGGMAPRRSALDKVNLGNLARNTPANQKKNAELQRLISRQLQNYRTGLDNSGKELEKLKPPRAPIARPSSDTRRRHGRKQQGYEKQKTKLTQSILSFRKQMAEAQKRLDALDSQQEVLLQNNVLANDIPIILQSLEAQGGFHFQLFYEFEDERVMLLQTERAEGALQSSTLMGVFEP
ncbi:MAG: pilus assembly protein PilM [Pirellulaceae bacterium]